MEIILIEIASTFRGKVLISLWLLIITFLIGAPVVGMLQNGSLSEHIFWGLIAAAILIDISNVISYFDNKSSQFLTKSL